MSTETLELFVAAYATESGAGEALKDFQYAHREGAIDLIDAAVIVHTAEDNVKFEETADPSRKPRAAAKPKARRPKPARPHTVASKPDPAPVKLRRGELGPLIVAEVTAKMSKGMSATKAFEEIAQERGMNAGTVSANYYRVLRSQKSEASSETPSKVSASLAKATPRTKVTKAPSGRLVASGDGHGLDRLAQDLVVAVGALAEAVKAQQTEVAEMRERLDQVRSVLD